MKRLFAFLMILFSLSLAFGAVNVTIKTYDNDRNPLGNIKVFYFDKQINVNNFSANYITTGSNGQKTISLDTGKEYFFVAMKEGYFSDIGLEDLTQQWITDIVVREGVKLNMKELTSDFTGTPVLFRVFDGSSNTRLMDVNRFEDGTNVFTGPRVSYTNLSGNEQTHDCAFSSCPASGGAWFNSNGDFWANFASVSYKYNVRDLARRGFKPFYEEGFDLSERGNELILVDVYLIPNSNQLNLSYARYYTLFNFNCLDSGRTRSSCVTEFRLDRGFTCDTQDCFEEAFVNCTANESYEANLQGFAGYVYSILGQTTGPDGKQYCKIRNWYTVNPNPGWVDKNMDCLYNNSLDLEESAQDALNHRRCTGELIDIMLPDNGCFSGYVPGPYNWCYLESELPEDKKGSEDNTEEQENDELLQENQIVCEANIKPLSQSVLRCIAEINEYGIDDAYNYQVTDVTEIGNIRNSIRGVCSADNYREQYDRYKDCSDTQLQYELILCEKNNYPQMSNLINSCLNGEDVSHIYPTTTQEQKNEKTEDTNRSFESEKSTNDLVESDNSEEPIASDIVDNESTDVQDYEGDNFENVDIPEESTPQDTSKESSNWFEGIINFFRILFGGK